MNWWRGWAIVLVLPFFVLTQSTGCASKKHCHNYQPGVRVKTSIQLSNCWDVEDGKYRCNNVLFDPREIKAK